MQHREAGAFRDLRRGRIRHGAIVSRRRWRDADAFVGEEGEDSPRLLEALPCAVHELAKGVGREPFEDRHGVFPSWAL